MCCTLSVKKILNRERTKTLSPTSPSVEMVGESPLSNCIHFLRIFLRIFDRILSRRRHIYSHLTHDFVSAIFNHFLRISIIFCHILIFNRIIHIHTSSIVSSILFPQNIKPILLSVFLQLEFYLPGFILFSYHSIPF